tara:strand:- start:4004 stop:5050 length:1047 start_codon:yes stop_codon:yes gene_type:complete
MSSKHSVHLDALATHDQETFKILKRGAEVMKSTGEMQVSQVLYTGTMYDEMCESLILFMANGEQVYRLGPVLESLLGQTECNSIPLEFVKFPFKSFYIELTDSSAGVWDGQGKCVKARGIYITPDFKSKGLVKFMFWGCDDIRAASDKKMFLDDGIQWLTLNLNKMPSTSSGNINVDEAFKKIYLDQSKDSSITGANRKHVEYSEVLGKEAAGGYDSMNYLLRLAFNAILYINSQQAEVGLPKKRKSKAIPRKLRRFSTLKSSPTVRMLGRSYENSKKHVGIAGGIGKRRVVPGHWRGVWVGTRKDENGEYRPGTHRERRWILPYIVNANSPVEVTRSTQVAQEPMAS